MTSEELQQSGRTGLPEKIGRYRILNRVGRGAMGVVYAAHDDQMGRPVAVKVLMGDLESDPETRARFYREAQAAAGLLHPNIITIYDAGEDNGRSYIAMQLLEGWPLMAYLRQPEAAPLERKLDLMVQMCEGLVAAHGRGIVHRDLKPGNIFVQSDGLLKILDFGVARLADSSMTATGAMIGTPDYMSPEQSRGTQVDARSDIFSTGAVFYFMLAGHKPFPGPDLPAVLRQLQQEEPEALRESEAPQELVRLVAHAMAKSPADRPARAQDLLAGVVRFRRHYHAETRKLASEVGARYSSIAAAEADLRAAAKSLDLTGPDDASPVLQKLRARFPSLVERGPVAFEAPSFDRSRITQVRAELEAEKHRVEAELVERARHLRQLEEGEQLLEAGRARAALKLFEEVVRERPDCQRAADLVATCGSSASEIEAKEDQSEQIMAHAAEAQQARDWPRVMSLCDEALALIPGLPSAAAMRAEAERAMTRDMRRREVQLRQALDRATISLADGRLDDAEAALRDVQGIDPSHASLARLRDELEDARFAAERADYLRRVTDEGVRRARGAFRRGRYEEAVAQLRDLAARQEAPDAATEADRLEALRGRIARSEQERRRQVMVLMNQARAAESSGDLDEAVTRAHDAVVCDPSDLDASALLDELSDRQLAMRLEQEHVRSGEARWRAAESMVRAAREAQQRGYVSAALEIALSASRIAPDRADIAELIEELRHLIAADDEEAYALTEEPFTVGPAAAPVTTASTPTFAPPAVPPAQVTPTPRDGGLLSQLRKRLGNK